jgi:hypothetical protein
LTRQANTSFPISPQAQKPQEYDVLFIPLNDDDQHDQYEASLHMQPFSKALTRLSLPPPSLTDTPSSNTKDFEAMEDKLDALVKKMQQLEFEDPRIKAKADEISQAILISIRSKQTQQQTRK